MSKFADRLWRDLVREHGPTLVLAERPQPGRARRPRVLAGSTLGLAGVGAALVLTLGGSAASPAFAVIARRDGSVSVKIYRSSGIAGANRKLAAMGIHKRLVAIYRHTSVRGETTFAAPTSLPQTCLKNQRMGRVVDVVFPSEAVQQADVGSGTYEPSNGTGPRGGVHNKETFAVVVCPVQYAGKPGAGQVGFTPLNTAVRTSPGRKHR
jgi:hypothetical protein